MQYKTTAQLENEFEELLDGKLSRTAVKNEILNFLLSQRKQDREAIREFANKSECPIVKNHPKECHYARAMLEILSFLDGLEGE